MIVRPATTFDRSIDRAFEQLTRSLFDSNRATSGPDVKGGWHDNRYVMTVDLPGIAPENVDVNVTANVLELAANVDGINWSRKIRLGEGLDTESISAHHVHGRLTIVVSKVAAAETRSVTIDTTPADLPSPDTAEAIEADAS